MRELKSAMKILNTRFTYDYAPHVAIKTEETIAGLLERDKSLISDEFTLVKAYLGGLLYTNSGWAGGEDIAQRIKRAQDAIDEITGKKNKNYIFLCQDVYENVKKINFYRNLVFTPHYSSHGFSVIPHYTLRYDDALIRKQKSYLFSFMGATHTHPIRKRLTDLYPDSCFSSGDCWGGDMDFSQIKIDRYVSLLGNSCFSLCPRGAGISTIRLFESMSMGAIPVIISDRYKPPLSDQVDWRSFSVTIKENKLNKIENVLKSFTADTIREMSQKTLDVYHKYFSNTNLHQTIIIELNKRSPGTCITQ